jgi:hypothetical protein
MITDNHERIVNLDEWESYRCSKIIPPKHDQLSPLPITGEISIFGGIWHLGICNFPTNTFSPNKYIGVFTVLWPTEQRVYKVIISIRASPLTDRQPNSQPANQTAVLVNIPTLWVAPCILSGFPPRRVSTEEKHPAKPTLDLLVLIKDWP